MSTGAQRPSCQIWDLPRISGTIEVRRAAETTDTALRPLTRSSAAAAPCTKEQLAFLFKCLGKLPTVKETSRGIHKFKTSLGSGAVFAHGVRQRFQGSVSGFRCV